MVDVDDFVARIEKLEQRIQELEDHRDITQLVAQYGPAVDSGSADEAAGLWTENGIFEAVGAITMRGQDEIAGMVRGAGHQDLILNGCGHVLTVPHVHLDGDEATGRSYAMNIRWDVAAQRFWVARVSANTWRWVRTPAGWKIADRVNANLDGGAEHRGILAPAAEDSRHWY